MSMKHSTLAGLLLLTAISACGAEDNSDDGPPPIPLDEISVQNLGIETVEAEETDFEETVFALGRVEAIPARRSGVSSRASGRIVELNATVGDTVEAGVEVAKLESRQPGSPPPRDETATRGNEGLRWLPRCPRHPRHQQRRADDAQQGSACCPG